MKLHEDTFHGGVPDHTARPDACSYRSGSACYHAMNPARMCSDDRHCMVAVLRAKAGETNVRPCGKLSGKACAGHENHDVDFAGCGSDYCIHNRP